MSNAKNKHRNIRKGGHVKTVRYHDLLRAKRTQNPLSGLNPAKVRRLYELYREGKYADVQLAWDALEEYDDMLGTVLERRQAALGEMEWDVLIDARAVGEDAALQALAEAQQDYITRRLREVENLSDAIKWLGLANFRRYSALEVLPLPSGERWLPIHHWHLCRPALEGTWCYNEAAETSCTRTEPIDMSAVILREVARPIDLVAMFLISAKEAAIDGWDSFLEVFGNPALFFKMPPGTSDERRDEYASIIKEISSDGAGVYPDGGEIHTVETSAANADAFSSRAEWCDKALVRRATGGLLTVLAESGSGTLAGSAHMEAFRQIAANDAISIAECINRQYVRRRIAAQFPGEPVLVYFKLTQPVINDRAATVNMLCQLAGQRWRATDEAVSEEVGVEVHTAPEPGAAAPGTPPAEPVLNACNQFAHDPGCPDAKPDKMPDDADDELREAFADADSMAHSGYTREQIWSATGIDYGPTPNGDSPTAADTIRQARAHERTAEKPHSATARFAHRRAAAHRQALQDSDITNSASTLEQPEQESPLNDGELAALRALGGELNPAQIAADAEYMTREMMAGLRKPVANSADAQAEDALMFESFEIHEAEPVANCNQYAHDADCTVSTTAAALRETPAGQTLQGVLDELRADSTHPSDAHVVLNPANQRTVDKVRELCGRDISQHKHSVSPSELHHARKKHTDMTDEDFMLMLDMHDNWDALKYENRSNIPKIKYTKTYDGKEYTLVERIGRTPRTPDKPRMLQFSTEFKADEKKRQKNGERIRELHPDPGSLRPTPLSPLIQP